MIITFSSGNFEFSFFQHFHTPRLQYSSALLKTRCGGLGILPIGEDIFKD